MLYTITAEKENPKSTIVISNINFSQIELELKMLFYKNQINKITIIKEN